ncbi:MAG: RagB/SusD family nutrient uptake outer membrane protein [Bacteroidales bacterium]|nr:RagB/SusD family nutrient uptake outer membrane protein [Bacteroidales bacterium]
MKKIIYSLLLILAFAGCKKEFLEVAPVGQLSSDNFLKNDNDVKLAVIGVYNKIQMNNSNAWNSAYFIKNLPADDTKSGGPNAGDQPQYTNLNKFNITSENIGITAIWKAYYSTISSCNTIIANVGANADATAGMKTMVGEAKALRAYTYLDLVIMFGGVPLMTVNPASTAEFNKPRATPEEVYAQIETDLKDAIAVLPVKSAYAAVDKFRFSKGTAQALLGKAYLYEKKYSDAAIVLGACISSNEYQLEPDYTTIWSKEHEFGIESVFEVSYTSQENYGWGNFPWGDNNAESNIELQLEAPRADGDGSFDFSNLDLTKLNLSGGWGANLPSKKIGDLLYSNPADKRIKGTVVNEAGYFAAGGKYQAGEYPYDYEGYLRLKYACKASETTTAGQPELNYGTNYRIIRYADVLLMAAEAYNKSSNDAAAQAELKKITDRAGIDAHTEAGSALFDQIVIERAKELCFEGNRYWDLVRWGLADQEMKSIGFVKGKNELFPIPLNEILSNTAMGEAAQNPGY